METRIKKLEDKVTELEFKLGCERQYAGHDISKIKGESTNKLIHISILASDAKDAIEVGEPGIAVRRIEAALRYIKSSVDDHYKDCN